MRDDGAAMRKYWPWITWTYRPLEPFAWAMIRFSAGAIMFTHGWARLFGPNPSFGFNAWVNWAPPMGVGVVELVGGACIALGLLTRPAALLLGLLWLLFTLGHTPSGRPQSWFMLGAIDHYPAMLVALNLAFFFRGGGRYSVDHAIGREI